MLFGKYGPDGSIEDDPDICVLTGEDIEPGDCRVQMTGTPYFVHVKAHTMNQLTPEKLAELKSLLPKDEPPAMLEAPAEAAPEIGWVQMDESAPVPSSSSRRSRSAAAEADKKEE